MRIELVCIGDELLTGRTINTNAATLAQELTDMGFEVSAVLMIPDEHKTLVEEITRALKRADFVITTGGLGPTGDDRTRKVFCEIFQTHLEHFPDWERVLQQKYSHLTSIEDQSYQPASATLLNNPIGTAPGLLFHDQLVALPGVPPQMKAIFQEHVKPYLLEQFTPKWHFQPLYLCGLIENDVDPFLRELEKKYPSLICGICPSYGTISVYLRSKEQEIIKKCTEAVKAEFSEAVYSLEDPRLEKAVFDKLCERKETLSFAESCTGGALSARITALAGASDFFLGSVVSYSNGAKQSLIHVSRETLERHGAVSEQTAKEMALGALKAFSSNRAIAVTGVAGPSGGSEDKPVGCVWLALVNSQGGSETVNLNGQGDRSIIIDRSVKAALTMLWKQIK